MVIAELGSPVASSLCREHRSVNSSKLKQNYNVYANRKQTTIEGGESSSTIIKELCFVVLGNRRNL